MFIIIYILYIPLYTGENLNSREGSIMEDSSALYIHIHFKFALHKFIQKQKKNNKKGWNRKVQRNFKIREQKNKVFYITYIIFSLKSFIFIVSLEFFKYKEEKNCKYFVNPNLDRSAHVCREIGNLICLQHLICLRHLM